MKKLRGGIAVGLGSTVAVLGITALSATSAFAGTMSPYPVPSGWHFEITGLNVQNANTPVAAGSYVDVTVSVYEQNPDNIIATGKPEDQHSMPATFPFRFVSGGTTVIETGVMSNPSDPSALNPMVPATGNMWTYTYKVPTPSMISGNSVTYSVYGGAGNLTTSEGSTTLPTYTPYMIHYTTNTASYYGTSGLYQNQWVDSDDPIYGKSSGTVTLITTSGEMPEVPYAGALPALFAAGAVFFFVRKRRRTN